MHYLTCVADCTVGMRVRHSGTGISGEGTIRCIDDDGIHVDFDRVGIHGIYDDDWFRRWPETLTLSEE